MLRLYLTVHAAVACTHVHVYMNVLDVQSIFVYTLPEQTCIHVSMYCLCTHYIYMYMCFNVSTVDSLYKGHIGTR